MYPDKYVTTNISPTTVESLSSWDEIKYAIDKRLVNGESRPRNIPVDSLVFCILADSGYNINHTTVSETHIDIFMRIWEFIETLRVSSSASLRETLDKCTKGRNSLGYLKYTDSTGVIANNPTVMNSLFKGKRDWVALPDEQRVSSVSLRESVIVDSAAVSLHTSTGSKLPSVSYIIRNFNEST